MVLATVVNRGVTDVVERAVEDTRPISRDVVPSGLGVVELPVQSSHSNLPPETILLALTSTLKFNTWAQKIQSDPHARGCQTFSRGLLLLLLLLLR